MGLFSGILKAATGVDVNYRETYFNRHPEQHQPCQMCGKMLDREAPRNSDEEMTIDHIWPQKLGSKFPMLIPALNSVANLQVLCRPCNSKKRDRISEVNFENSGRAILREILTALQDLGIYQPVPREIQKMLDQY
jgi:5-methylcytosine-specific restriction endonuclease McrA